VNRDGITCRLRTLVFGALVAALIGAGVRGLLVGAPSSTPAGVARVPATRHTGVRSTGGALDAATSFVRDGQRVFDLPLEERGPALRELAATAAADGFVAQQMRYLAQLDGIAGRGRGALTWDVAVLATRVDAWTRHRARIEIWRLGVLSIEGLTAPLAEYTTVAYELVWERGAWRIWSETQTPGPSPMPLPESTPSSPQEWRAALTGFHRYPGGEPI
jgi:hypothetical protein